MEEFVFKLFITGKNAKAVKAMNNIHKILEKKTNIKYNLEVIDILSNPEVATNENILATPMLIKKSPAPVLRVNGDLSDTKKLLNAIDLE